MFPIPDTKFWSNRKFFIFFVFPLKKEISKTNITVTNDDNSISLVISGDHLVQKITISESIDTKNINKLENQLKEVINKGNKEVDKMSSEKLSALSKQGIPTDLPF